MLKEGQGIEPTPAAHVVAVSETSSNGVEGVEEKIAWT